VTWTTFVVALVTGASVGGAMRLWYGGWPWEVAGRRAEAVAEAIEREDEVPSWAAIYGMVVPRDGPPPILLPPE
jgi:hypothetical protein